MLIFGGVAFSYKVFLFFPLPFWISWPSQMFRSPETFSAMTQELWSVANVGVHRILLCGTDDSKCISSYRPVALVAFFCCFFPKNGGCGREEWRVKVCEVGGFVCSGETLGTLPCKKKRRVQRKVPCHLNWLHLKKSQIMWKRVKHNEDEAD